MLVDGELDAVFSAREISSFVNGAPNVGLLFPNYREVEMEYYRRSGMFPIMHLTAIREELANKHPWVAGSILNAFNESKKIAMKRAENARIVPLVWYREAWQEQEEIVGPDQWEHGATERNIKSINTIAGYAQEQGLTKQKFGFKDLFPQFV